MVLAVEPMLTFVARCLRRLSRWWFDYRHPQQYVRVQREWWKHHDWWKP